MSEDSVLELGVCTSFGSILYHNEINITSFSGNLCAGISIAR